MESNIIYADFSGGRTVARTSPVYQLDKGLVLQFVGLSLPEYFEVHFANSENGEARVQIGHDNGAEIPKSLLKNGAYVYAWVYLQAGEDSYRTMRKAIIPVEEKAKPRDDETPEEKTAVREAIEALNRTGEEVREQMEALTDRLQLVRIGAEDFSTAWSPEGEVLSDSVQVNDGEQVTLVLRNYTDGQGNWHNFMLKLTADGTYTLYFRPDNYAWGNGGTDGGANYNWNWNTFQADMQGALVEVCIIRHHELMGNNRVRVEMRVTTAEGKSFRQWYNAYFTSNYTALTAQLTVDHAYIDLYDNLTRKESCNWLFLDLNYGQVMAMRELRLIQGWTNSDSNYARLLENYLELKYGGYYQSILQGNQFRLYRNTNNLPRVKLSGEDSNVLEVNRAVSGKTAVPFFALRVPHDVGSGTGEYGAISLYDLFGQGRKLVDIVGDYDYGYIVLKAADGHFRNRIEHDFICYSGTSTEEETAKLGHDGTLTLLGTTLTAAKLGELLTFTPITLDGDGKVQAEQASAAIVTKSADCTLALSEAGRLLQVDAAADVTVTVPAHADVAFPVGTEIEVCQWGAGTVSIAGAAGVTIRSLDGCTDTAGQYATVALKKMSSNEWLLTGALA